MADGRSSRRRVKRVRPFCRNLAEAVAVFAACGWECTCAYEEQRTGWRSPQVKGRHVRDMACFTRAGCPLCVLQGRNGPIHGYSLNWRYARQAIGHMWRVHGLRCTDPGPGASGGDRTLTPRGTGT